MLKQYNSTYVNEVIDCKVENLTETVDGRYLLKIKLKNDCTDTLTIIMMNPSRANESYSDDTVNKIASFLFQMNMVEDSLVKNIGIINILNIFPVYQPNVNKLGDILDEIIADGKFGIMQHKNKITFEEALAESQNVILAWGDVPDKVNAKSHTNEVLMMFNSLVKYKLLDNTYVIKYKEFEQILTKKNRPRHPGRKTPQFFVKVKNMSTVRNFLYISI